MDAGVVVDWASQVREAVFSFPGGSAPGPSGLRPCHLRACFEADGVGGGLEEAFALLVKAAMEGKVPGALSEVMCASSLIPINKKDGGIRPIAIGDTLRRVVGKAIVRSPNVVADLQKLQPRQTGVGVKGAAELVGMGIQRTVDTLDPTGSWVLLQVDVKNAFNSLSRAAVLQGCISKCPHLYNWLSFCYAKHSPLVCQGSFLCWSQTGVHQGDACGPAAFALGLDMALDQASLLTPQGGKCLWESWYLDDGTLVGEVSEVLNSLIRLASALWGVGLSLNPAKCKLWGPGIQKGPSDPITFPADLPLGHAIRQIPVNPFALGFGLTTLGVPADSMGGSEHSKGKWASAVGDAVGLLRKLKGFPEAQIRHVLLRHCLDACKVMHLLRSTDCRKAGAGLGLLSDAIREATSDLAGAPLSDLEYEQASLPIVLSGLGIRDPIKEASHARVAALAGFEVHGSSRVGVPRTAYSLPAPDLTYHLGRLTELLGPNAEPLASWSRDCSLMSSAQKDHTMQHWWAELVGAARRSAIGQECTVRDLVRLKSQEGPFANGWLQVIPSDGNDTLLSSSDFSLLTRWWLGKGILPQTGQLPACPLCSSGVVDPFGDHLVSCAKNGIGARHNLVRDTLFHLCAQADIPVSRERSCEEGSRDADLLLHGWCKGRDAAWDVTIIHPCQHAAFPLNCSLAVKSLAVAEPCPSRVVAWLLTIPRKWYSPCLPGIMVVSLSWVSDYLKSVQAFWL